MPKNSKPPKKAPSTSKPAKPAAPAQKSAAKPPATSSLDRQARAGDSAAPARPKRALIRESDVTLADIGERAHIMPGEDPHLTITVNTISSDPHEMRARIIPVCEPLLAGNEEKYLLRTVQTNWISSAGKFITDFENLSAATAKTIRETFGVAT